VKKLISEYRKKRYQIKRRLKEFESLRDASDEDIFAELSFCILTPQTNALYCDKAIKGLKESGLLLKGRKAAISEKLKRKVRFHDNKAGYLVSARKLFKRGKEFDIKSKLDTKDILKTRDWLVKNIKGLGYKEASHFLRNIGLGKNIAIIDRHILYNLKKYGVIIKIPTSINKRTYIDIENRMKEFSRRLRIPIDELDLLLWSKKTGYIFK
jgi:N-glycosylase/DNA lyase